MKKARLDYLQQEETHRQLSGEEQIEIAKLRAEFAPGSAYGPRNAAAHQSAMQTARAMTKEQFIESLCALPEIEEIRADNRKLRREIDIMRKAAERRNRELDALHYVWCSGGCKSGIHRYGEHPPLTKELVEIAIDNTNRLVSWLGHHSFRLANAALVHDADSVRMQYGRWWEEWVQKANALRKELDAAKARIAELEAHK